MSVLWGMGVVKVHRIPLIYLSTLAMFQVMHQERRLNQFLLDVTKSIFTDIVSVDAVILKIMNFAQSLVDAERTSLFLVCLIISL